MSGSLVPPWSTKPKHFGSLRARVQAVLSPCSCRRPLERTVCQLMITEVILHLAAIFSFSLRNSHSEFVHHKTQTPSQTNLRSAFWKFQSILDCCSKFPKCLSCSFLKMVCSLNLGSVVGKVLVSVPRLGPLPYHWQLALERKANSVKHHLKLNILRGFLFLNS